MSEKGIESSKKALVAVNEVALELIKVLKDGVQMSDALTIIQDFQNSPDFQAKLLAAAASVQEVPAEISDLSIMEGLDLAQVQMSYVPKILEAMKPAAEIV